MKQLIAKLETIQAAFEKQIVTREETFGGHSEKWQESEKGEEYQEQTERLREMYDDLTDWIDELS